MAFPSTVDCCGATRLQTLKAQLGAVQNLAGADPANNPAIGDTYHQTLEKLAHALGAEFNDCCRLETIHTLAELIAGLASPGTGGIPEGALLDENGNPVLDENGDYIIVV